MTWIIIVFMTLFGALGGLLLKQVSRVDSLPRKLTFFVAGCGVYGIGAILNVIALRFMPYTVVFPLTAFTYIWTFIFSYFLLGEQLNRYKIVGLLLIIGGAFLIVK